MFYDLIQRNDFTLYVVTDDKFLPSSASKKDISYIRDIVKRCADGGAKIFQYRAKLIEPVFQIKQAMAAKDECEKNGLIFFVNDRADLAYIIGAYGVHVGQEDIPPDFVKEKFSILRIGFSTHNIKQVKSVRYEIVDYISFGPIFGTRTKESIYPATGIENLRRALKISRVPVVAIGGINSANVREVVRTGCKVVACISYVLENHKEITVRCKRIIREAMNEIRLMGLN